MQKIGAIPRYAVLIILDKNADCILNIIYYPISG